MINAGTSRSFARSVRRVLRTAKHASSVWITLDLLRPLAFFLVARCRAGAASTSLSNISSCTRGNTKVSLLVRKSWPALVTKKVGYSPVCLAINPWAISCINTSLNTLCEVSLAMPHTERVWCSYSITFASLEPRNTLITWAFPNRPPVLMMLESIFWVSTVASTVSFLDWQTSQVVQVVSLDFSAK